MHSSRMRTAHALTVSPSMLCAKGGVPAPRGSVCSWGVSAPGWGLLPGGACSQGGVCSWGGGIPACTEADPPLWTESQTCVKTLPCPNFVTGGNKNKQGPKRNGSKTKRQTFAFASVFVQCEWALKEDSFTFLTKN